MKRYVLPLLILAPTLACNEATTGTTAMRLDPDGDFYAMPYPNNLRLDTAGKTIAVADFPNAKDNVLVDQMLELAASRQNGFSPLAVVSFSFTGPLALDGLDMDAEMLPSETPLAFYVNVEAGHPNFGAVTPALASWFPVDGNYVVANTLTLIPYNGKVLDAGADHAAIVLRAVGDAEGKLLAQHADLAAALAGQATVADLITLYAPLRAWLDAAQTETRSQDIAAATVFRTSDHATGLSAIVADATARFVAEMSTPFTLATNDPGDPAFCFFEGKMRLPQFQTGNDQDSFSTYGEGELAFDEDGKLVKQRDEDVRVVLVIPKEIAMPAAGFPYVEYVHGSGGIANQILDRGKVSEVDGEEMPWRGPGWIMAKRGYASGSNAMPVSPDRVPGATDFGYLQITNLGSLRGNFQQGVIELVLKRQLLYGLAIDATVCPDADVPGGTIKLDPTIHVTQGQSMGAMYANIYGAIATDTVALIPTGAGGYWSFLPFTTDLIPEAGELLTRIIGAASGETLDHRHPLMGMFQQYIDAIDPMVFAPRIVRDPLPGVPAKHIYVPHGRNDLYFSHHNQRALAVAYGFPLGEGEDVESTMADNLNYFYDFSTLATPIEANFTAGDGSIVTAAQLEFFEDPIQENGHTIYVQRAEVQFQYGCFLESLRLNGVPTIAAAAGQDNLAACP